MDRFFMLTGRALSFLMAAVLFANLPALAVTAVSSFSETAIHFPTYFIASQKEFPHKETTRNSEVWDISADGSTIVGVYEDTSVEPYNQYGYTFPHKAFITNPSKQTFRIAQDRSIDGEPGVLRLDGDITDVAISDDGSRIAFSVCREVGSTRPIQPKCRPYISFNGDTAVRTNHLTKNPDREGSYQVYDISPDGRFIVGKDRVTQWVGPGVDYSRQYLDHAYYYDISPNTERKYAKYIPVERVLRSGNMDHAALGISGDNNTIVGYSYLVKKFRSSSSASLYHNSHVELYDDSRAFIYHIDRDRYHRYRLFESR